MPEKSIKFSFWRIRSQLLNSASLKAGRVPSLLRGLIWNSEIKGRVWKIVLGAVPPRKGTCGFAWEFPLCLEKNVGGYMRIPVRRN
jgi:hypothetical protein